MEYQIDYYSTLETDLSAVKENGLSLQDVKKQNAQICLGSKILKPVI